MYVGVGVCVCSFSPDYHSMKAVQRIYVMIE